MKTFILLLSFSLVLFVMGCHKNNPPANPPMTCQNLEYLCTNDTCSHPSDAFILVSDTVIGDDLKLTITYGGGCASHNFKLVWNQYALPPFDVIKLEHNANGDQCKALVTNQLCFNLSLLKQGQVHGETDFPFSDTNANSVIVKYKF